MDRRSFFKSAIAAAVAAPIAAGAATACPMRGGTVKRVHQPDGKVYEYVRFHEAGSQEAVLAMRKRYLEALRLDIDKYTEDLFFDTRRRVRHSPGLYPGYAGSNPAGGS